MKRSLTPVILIASVMIVSIIGICLIPVTYPPPQKSDVIAVMAGSYKERVPTAARLFHEGFGKLVLLPDDSIRAGWSEQHGRYLYYIERSEEELVRLGVPRNRIVKLPYNGSSTMSDALAVKRYVLEHDIRSLLLVTSDYHLQRAFWSCRQLFRNYPVTLTASPAKSVNAGVVVYAVECFKLVYYRFRWGVSSL